MSHTKASHSHEVNKGVESRCRGVPIALFGQGLRDLAPTKQREGLPDLSRIILGGGNHHAISLATGNHGPAGSSSSCRRNRSHAACPCSNFWPRYRLVPFSSKHRKRRIAISTRSATHGSA